MSTEKYLTVIYPHLTQFVRVNGILYISALYSTLKFILCCKIVIIKTCILLKSHFVFSTLFLFIFI